MARTENRLESRVRIQALRFLTLSIIKLTTQRHLSKLFKRPKSPIFFLNLCIKFGDAVTLAEASALQFIAENTSIPVPKVYHAFSHRGDTYILMERIRGETIAKRWRSLSETSRASIFSQLKRMVEELRSVPPETISVCNVDGGPIHDYRLPQTSSWGPFSSVGDFHLALRNYLTSQSQISSSLSPATISDLKKLVAFHKSTIRPPVLTHGDLSSFNILLRDDQVVGIIDWETAGWLPYYWEYTTAWNANPQNYFWQREVDSFLDPYKMELEMDKLRRKYFGEI